MVRLGLCNFGRILVETRSSVNLLFLSILRVLNFGIGDVHREDMSFFEFNKSTTYAIGIQNSQ